MAELLLSGLVFTFDVLVCRNFASDLKVETWKSKKKTFLKPVKNLVVFQSWVGVWRHAVINSGSRAVEVSFKNLGF